MNALIFIRWPVEAWCIPDDKVEYLRREFPDVHFTQVFDQGDALRAIRELGLAFPKDVALVAFDDSPWTTLTSPQLSVVAQPAYEIGRVTAELLASARERRSPRTIVLSPRLIVRESSMRRQARAARSRN